MLMITGSGESDFVTARLTMGFTVVVVLAELLAAFGSGSVAETVAVFETDGAAAAPGVTVIVTMALAPLLSIPRLHVTVVVPEQVPWLGVAVPKVRLAASASVTVTLVAGEGPPFVTVMV